MKPAPVRQPVLWHGSPVEDASVLEANPSFLHALWLTGDPSIAALYAGPAGFVHAFLPAPDLRLLQADGTILAKDRPAGLVRTEPNYPDPDTWGHVRSFLEDRRYDLDCFECMDASRIEHGFAFSLGAEGQPSWEALLADFYDVTDDGEELIRSLGYEGVAQDERPDLALGDRSRTIADSVDPVYAALARHLRARRWDRSLSVGVFDPSRLSHVVTLSAREVSASHLRNASRVTLHEDLAAHYVGPLLPERPALPARR